MDLKIAGKRALVLGGNRGMGLAIARALAAEGVSVLLAARDNQVLATAAAEIGAAGTFAVDLSDTASLEAFAGAVGDIDILINNTGGPP
jgi:3-oxoacyl-[acyl-carrier protein] reductase